MNDASASLPSTALPKSRFKLRSAVEGKALLLARQIIAVTLSAGLIFGQTGKTSIVASGTTKTTVTTSGNITNVTTGTVAGKNAYNSFTNFSEQSGSTVNLFLPNGTSNLLNLVNTGPATIDGILNSILNGKVGGNVFFADPYGIIVGKNGVVNVGAFTAVTPTTGFMSQFFSSTGDPSAAATASMLSGTVPITPDGLISVQGKINAAQNIGLFGGTVNNSGTITSGAVFGGVKPDFSDVVNVAGLQSGTALVVQNGSIQIQAAGDVENSGSIVAPGSANLNGGDISIQAGHDLKLDSGSLISAAGAGAKSSGGNVQLRAAQDAEIDSGALVTAAAGGSGNGGQIDFSATGTLNFNGGQLKAGAAKGVAGTVTIDPNDLNITSNDTPNDGSNISFSGETISIAPGVVISSRQIGSGTDWLNSPSVGNSGSITLTATSTVEAPTINVGDGAEILAHATNGFTAGNVTLQATQADEEAAAAATAKINIGNALIQGQDVTLSATSTATSNSGPDAPISGALNDTSLGFLVNGPASINTGGSTSAIVIGNLGTPGNASIKAAGNLTINASATTKTTSGLTGIAGVAYGEADSTATATVSKNATLVAAGALTLNATSNDKLDVSETSTQEAQSTGSLAFGKASSTSDVEVNGAVTGGSVQIGATNQNSFSTSASPTDFGTTTGNANAIAIALGFYTSKATTTLAGSATSTNADVQIGSSTTDATSVVNSSASEPADGVKAKLASAEAWVQNLGGRLSQATVTGILGSSPSVSPEANSSSTGLAAAVSFEQTGNTATTTISGTVQSAGKSTISSIAQDNPQIGAQGAAGGQDNDYGGAIAVSDFTNTSNTFVNGEASVTSIGASSVTAEADMLNPALQTVNGLVNDYNFKGVNFSGPVAGGTGWGDALVSDGSQVVNSIKTSLLGFANPGEYTTTFVNTGLSTAAKESDGVGLAGSVSLLGMTNQSTASVTGSASVVANTGDVNVNATSNVTTFNVLGMGLGVGQVAKLNPGVNSNTSLGGSFNGADVTNTSTAYIGDGTTAVATQGSVSVNATTQTLSIGITQAGDKATQFGITGSFGVDILNDSAEGYIQSDATVNAAQNVNVNANNTLSDFIIGGSLGLGGTTQVGVAVNWNAVSDTTLAYIGDPADSRGTICSGCGVTAGASVNVTPTSTENLYSLTFAASKSGNTGKGADGETPSSDPAPTGDTAPAAPTSGGNSEGDNGAGGGTFGFGVSGEIAINQVTDFSNDPGITTKGFINNGASVTATTGKVNVTATDTLFAVAAGLAGTVAQSGALAGAYGQNSIVKDVEAFTDNTAIEGDGLTISALSNGSLFAVTAGGAINTEENIALAGSVNNNSVTNIVNASLGDNTVIPGLGPGGVSVTASEGAKGDQIVSVAGGVSISSGGAGVGAAVDIGNYTNKVSASIGDAFVNTQGNVSVTALTGVQYLPIAASLAGSADFTVAGSLADESISNNTTSSVAGTVTSTGNVLVASTDVSGATTVAGAVGYGGNVGVGVSAILPDFRRTTIASIASGASVSAVGSDSGAILFGGQRDVGTMLDAQTGGAFSDYSVAGSGSGSSAVAGAVILNHFGANTPNSLKDDTEATIGSGATVNGSNNTTTADQSVQLLATDTATVMDVAGMAAVGSDLGAGVGFDQMVPDWIVNASIGNGASVNATENVVVQSTLQNAMNSYVVAGAGSGSAAAAGAATVINETSNVTASADGTVNAGGSVAVDATRTTSNINILDGNLAVAVGIGAGFGVSSANTTTNDTVAATIGSGGAITALAYEPVTVPNGQVDGSGNPLTSQFTGVAVTAVSSNLVTPVAAGGAGSIAVGVEGSVPVTNLTVNTSAQIDNGATVNKDETGVFGGQSVQVLATDQTKVSSLAGSVAAGAAGLAAAVDSETVNRTITAAISNANVKADTNVVVGANTLGSITSVAASGSVGGFSAAGAVSNIDDTTNTNAFVSSGANVTAQNSVEIAAQRNTTLTANDGSGAIGGVGVNGSVANLTQLNNMSAYVGGASDVTALALGSNVNVPVAAANGTPTSGSFDGLSISAVGSQSEHTLTVGGGLSASASVSGSVTNANYTENTYAQIQNSSTINGANGLSNSSQGINILAADTTTPTSVDGAGAGSLGLGIGAAADVENIEKTVHAQIEDGSTVNAGGSVNINALSTDTITSTTASAAVGVAGLAGTTSDYQTNPISPNVAASIGNSSVNAGNVTVNASENLGLTAVSGEASAGGVAFGAATLLGTSDAVVAASTGLGSQISTSGNLNVTSNYTSTLKGSAYAGTAGIVAADAAYATLTDNGFNEASIAGTVSQANQATANATTTRILTAVSEGLSGSIALAGGAAVALTSAGGYTFANSDGTIGLASSPVGTVLINASDNTSANSTAKALSFGIGSGEYNDAQADVNSSVETEVFNNSTINAGTVTVTATGKEGATGTLQGQNYGAATVGSADSEASSTPLITAEIGDGSTINASVGLGLGATYQSQGVSATSHMSAGSLINAQAGTSTAIANDSPTVMASIGDNNNSTLNVNGGAVQVQTISTTYANADFEGEDYTGVNIPGDSVATANVNNTNQISVGNNVNINVSSIGFEAESVNQVPNSKDIAATAGLISVGGNSDGSTANACINSPSSCGFNGTPGGTSISVNKNSLLNAGSGDVSLSATAADITNVLSQGTVNGGIVTNNNTANQTIDDSPSVLLSGATIDAGTTELTSKLGLLTATAESNSITAAAGSVSNSTSNTTVNISPSVTLVGATINSPQSVTITASLPDDAAHLQANNLATASINGFTGSIDATSTNNSSYYPTVYADSATSVTTGNLTVLASSPIPPNAGGNGTTNPFYSNNADAVNNTVVSWVLTTVEEVVDETIGEIPFIGPLIKKVTKEVTKWVEKITDSSTDNVVNGNFNSAPTLTLNFNLYQEGGAGASLTANPGSTANNAVFSGTGITAKNDGQGDIVVNDIVNSGAELVSLSAPSGSIQGTMNIYRDTAYPTIKVTNNTSENLIINQIEPLSDNQGNPDISLTAGDTSGFSDTFHTKSSPTVITVQNNSGSNVTFQGYVNNSFGIMNVNDTGGNILGATGNLLENNQVSLDAGGSVGTVSDPLNIRLVSNPNPNTPNLAVAAGSDVNINLGVVGYAGTPTNVPTSITGATVSSMTAGGSVNLAIASPLALVLQPDRSYLPSAVDGNYDLQNISATGNITVTQEAGSMTVENAASTNGFVRLTDQFDNIAIGSIKAPNSYAAINAFLSLTPLNSGTNLDAGGITLAAQNGTIGSGPNAPINIVSTGQLGASAASGIYVTQVSGDMQAVGVGTNTGDVDLTTLAGNLYMGSVSSLSGALRITSSGSILSNGDPISAQGPTVNLLAQNGSIGIQGQALTISSAAGEINAQANQDVNITEIQGNPTLAYVSSKTGNVTVTDQVGDAIVEITAAKNATLTSTVGNIVETGNEADVVGQNVTLAAPNGAIGSATTPFQIQASGQLTAQAAADIAITQPTGNLLVNTINTTGGNVDLSVLKGDVDLGVITAPARNTGIYASGGILNSTNAPLNITSNQIALSAQTGAIGSPATPVNVDGTQLTANAGGSVNVDQTTGPMNVYTVTSANGNVVLTAANGSVQLGTVNAASGNTTITASQSIINSTDNDEHNVNSENVTLTAQTGAIGSAAAPISMDATGVLTAQAQQGIYVTEIGDDLNVATVTSTAGAVALRSNGGDVNLGTVNANTSPASITASGSILDTNTNAATSTINSGALTLNAASGSVGTSSTPLPINATGQVNAQGNQGVFLTETNGSLNVGTIGSETGGITLKALAGTVNLGLIDSPNGNASITASQSILNPTDSGSSNIYSQNLSLTAQNGAIGSATAPIDIDASGLVTGQAAQSIYTTELSGNLNINSVASTSGAVTLQAMGGNVDLGTINANTSPATVIASGSILDTNPTATTSVINSGTLNLTAQTGSVGTVTVPLPVHPTGLITAQGSQGVYLTQTTGSMNLGTINSGSGSVSLTASSGNLNLGTINATSGNTTLKASGSILDTNKSSASTINSQGVSLTASTGSIGTPLVFLPIEATGKVTAQAYQSVNLTQTAGALNVATITSTTGNVNLAALSGSVDLGTVNSEAGNTSISAYGSILDTNNSAASDINADTISLNAQTGSIGTSTDLLNIQSNYERTFFPGIVTANAKLGIYLNQVNGSIYLNQITSQSSDVVLHAQGSILNALGLCALCVNVTGNNTSFVSQAGTIGQYLLPLLVNNRNPNTGTSGSNYLNASAASDVYVEEVQGNLLSNLISSTSGNIGLQTLNGSGVLNQILGTQSVSVIANGTVMNIQTIGAPAGSTSVNKSPSPNTVYLAVGRAGGALTVNQLSAFRSVTTRADVTNLGSVIATNLSTNSAYSSRQANALVMDMTGWNGGVANSLNAIFKPCSTCSVINPVIFNHYWTQSGAVLAGMDWIELVNAYVGSTAQFQNNYLNVAVTNHDNPRHQDAWTMFIVGSQEQTNANSEVHVSTSLLNSKKTYVWPEPQGQTFNFLWNYFNVQH